MDIDEDQNQDREDRDFCDAEGNGHGRTCLFRVFSQLTISHSKPKEKEGKMATYFMYGKYSKEALASISAERTKKAAEVIAKAGGKLVSAYALLGKYDLVAITNFPGTAEVMKASIALNKLTGIAFTSFPAIPVEEFDKIKE